jgi:hypothetical protein
MEIHIILDIYEILINLMSAVKWEWQHSLVYLNKKNKKINK